MIFGCQRFSINDGPGIRTSVFLKGCNLRCAWCHNPEGISRKPELSYTEAKCVGCGSCAAVCPTCAHKMADGKHDYDRNACILCSKCVDACPSAALAMYGNRVTAEEVLKMVLRDRIYYEESGGVTLSGGEALLQLDFAMAVLQLCRDAKIHCAVETHGMHPFSVYEKVMPLVDLFLFDYKMTDADMLQKFTGANKQRILDNLRRLHDAGAKIQVRCPIIPGLNDNEEHIRAIAQLTVDMPNLFGVELLPYHNLGTSKSTHIGLNQNEYKTPDPETMKTLNSTILRLGGRLTFAE
jgi:pyruvate formate lyase activating enzyme